MSKMLGAVPRCLTHHEKSDEDENPHFNAVVVSEDRGAWAIGKSARSSRNRFTNREVSPTRAWNTRLASPPRRDSYDDGAGAQLF